MTNAAETSNQFPDGAYAVVEAFVDGEPVACDVLRDALATPDAREHLIDLLVLRRAVAAMGPATWSTQGRQRVVRMRTAWLAAAAAVLVSLTAGYLAGQRTLEPSVAAQTVEAVVQVDSAPVAPKPTQVITLQPGVNWTERAGGR
jgi:hypothetical protein